MATASSTLSHANEKSKPLSSALSAPAAGRCDFAPAWLKHPQQPPQQQQQHQYQQQRFVPPTAPSSYATPRARTPNDIDAAAPDFPRSTPFFTNGAPSTSTSSSSSSSSARSSSVLNNATSRSSGGVGVGSGGGAGGGGLGPRLHSFTSDLRPGGGASLLNHDRGPLAGGSSSSNGDHQFVRRQKSLDSFGGGGGGGGPRLDHNRTSPPSVRGEREGPSRGLEAGFRGSRNGVVGERVERNERSDRGERGERSERGDRIERGDRGERNERVERGERGDRGPVGSGGGGGSRGRTSFDEEDHSFSGNARSRGRQTNGSTPSTNPNYFYYGTPPTPPNNSNSNNNNANTNGTESRSDRAEEEDRGRSNGHRGHSSSYSSSRHDHTGGGGGSGGGGNGGYSSRSQRDADAASDDGANNSMDWRPRRGNNGVSAINDAPSYSNGVVIDHFQPPSDSGRYGGGGNEDRGGRGGARDGGRESGRECGRDGGRDGRDSGRDGNGGGKRHSSGSSFDSYGRYGGDDRWNNGSSTNGSNGSGSGSGGGGVMESAIGYWEYEPPPKEEDQSKREPPPPDAEEEFPSLEWPVPSGRRKSFEDDGSKKELSFGGNAESLETGAKRVKATAARQFWAVGDWRKFFKAQNREDGEKVDCLGGSSDLNRSSGKAVWLGKQKSQTIVSSQSTRVQLKQQNVLNGGSGSGVTSAASSSVVNGVTLGSSTLLPPKMSRRLPTSTDRRRPIPAPTLTSAVASKSTVNGVATKESSFTAIPLSAPALMEISRIVKPLKIREEKKSQFLRALRDDQPTTTHSNNNEDDAEGDAIPSRRPSGGRRQQQQHLNGSGDSSRNHHHQKRNGGARSGSLEEDDEEEEEELEDVFPSHGDELSSSKRRAKMNGEGDGGGVSSSSSSMSSMSSSSERRRPSTSSSSGGGGNLSTAMPNLSSSLEAEKRLLLEMGWEEEEEEDDDWQLSEEELREVQAKIKEFSRGTQRSLTPLTLNVLASTFDAVDVKTNVNESKKVSSDDQFTPIEELHCNDLENGVGTTSSSSSLLIAGFENNNHKSFPSSVPFGHQQQQHTNGVVSNKRANNGWENEMRTSDCEVGAEDKSGGIMDSRQAKISLVDGLRNWRPVGGRGGNDAIARSSDDSYSDLSDVDSD